MAIDDGGGAGWEGRGGAGELSRRLRNKRHRREKDYVII